VASDFAKRDKIKLVRDTPNGPIVQRIDLSDKVILESDLYYVYPNDILIVEPMKAKTWGIGPTFSFALITGALSLVVLILALK